VPPIIAVIDKRFWKTACSLIESRLPRPGMKGHGGCCFQPVSEPAYASGQRRRSVPIYGRVCSCQERFIRWLSHPT